jgi:hypothetical protein
VIGASSAGADALCREIKSTAIYRACAPGSVRSFIVGSFMAQTRIACGTAHESALAGR